MFNYQACILPTAMVILFVICHLPRVLLDLHEVATLEQLHRCGPAQWTFPIISFSHIFLVVFCSSKLLIYCYISSQIKQEFKVILCHYHIGIKPYRKIEERYDRTALRTLIKTGLRTGMKAGTTGTV